VRAVGGSRGVRHSFRTRPRSLSFLFSFGERWAAGQCVVVVSEVSAGGGRWW